MTDRKAFEEGMILALVSPPLPHVAKKEPIAYLYNGVRLPALPEWDREAYPYAFIIYSWDGYSLDLWPTLPLAKDVPDTVIDGYGPEHLPATILCYLTNGSEEWTENGNLTYAPNVYSRVAPFWGNTDIYTLEGTLYLAASEPVPVYE